EGEEIILNVERAEFETDQIVTSFDYDIGTVVYFDASEGKLTEDETDRLAGIVTNPKDENNVIWFLLTNFGFVGSGGEGLKGEKGDPGEQGPPGADGKDAEPQFTEEQVAALLALLEE